MGLMTKIRTEVYKNGIMSVLKKGSHKLRRFLFYSTCSIWFVKYLDGTDCDFVPELSLEFEFMSAGKSELVEWLEKNKEQFNWIYYKKEIDVAEVNDHIFFILKHDKKIIGYVKVGFNDVYIHDFDKIMVFEPGTAFIYDIFILPEYQGRKLALFSVNKVSEFLSAQGCNRIICHIEKWNMPSIKTFERAGFFAIDSIRFIRIAKRAFYLQNDIRPFLNLEKMLLNRTLLIEKSE